MKSNFLKKVVKCVGALMVGAILVATPSTVAFADGSYTYCYDYWGDVQDSPDAYEVARVFTTIDLGIDKAMNLPEGLTVVGNTIYVCDTNNNRILELERTDREHIEFVREITEFKGDVEVNTFNKPTDMQVGDDGCFYICDNGNARVVKLDSELNYVRSFLKPDDPTLDKDLVFQPTKLVVDGAGRVYCIATGINKGLVKYEANGEFSGFVGATPVVYKWYDYIWKRFASQEARAKMQNFVPTEYNNLYMDKDGFIYCVSSNLDEDALKAGDAEAIRKLNLMGTNILIENGEWPVYGDLYWGTGGGYEGPSKYTDITTFENDIYVALDKNRGRLFAYDSQGRLLYAFGGGGNMDGYFNAPTAIDHMGYDILVLDSINKSITVFTPTSYGQKIFNAIDSFDDGEYEKSGELWQEVMDTNGNYDLAYIGVGRSLLRQEKYREAMDYFELKYDDENYSKAFKQYRKQWVEEHILIIFIVIIALLVIPMIIGKIGKIKYEIDTADIFRY